jgi:opacity protein-like surface antigen
MKKLFLIIVSLALPPASALAADLQLPFKSPAETFSWTGFYVGGNAGGAWGSERVSQTLTAPPPFLAVDTAAVSSAASPTFQSGSATAGAQAGYNYQWGNWVVGGLGSLDDRDCARRTQLSLLSLSPRAPIALMSAPTLRGSAIPGELQACERKPAASRARGWGDLRFATIRRYSAKLRIADLRLRTAFGVNTGTAFGASQCSA